MWGVPGRILKLVQSLKATSPSYLFAIAVNAGEVSNALVQLQTVCAKKQLTLASGISIVMPSNYIPWGGPGPVDEQTKLFEAARDKIRNYSQTIRELKTVRVEKGPLWQRIIYSQIYKISLPHISKMDKSFFADEKCTGCGICEKVCPAKNIRLTDGKPVWNRRCEQCLACIQWCPAKAIQYGKKTHSYERYHQPEIKTKDMIAEDR
jgi:ferredoxin